MTSQHTGFASAADVRELANTQADHATVQAVHTNRLDNVERSHARLEDKLDKVQWWIIGTLATTLGGILVSLFKH